ncbi:MAG: PAS domain-containing protein [Treponema sp.]|jgi:two-component system phosphate regulon sensor histidine kinase PhoR|nr:PAS domain-containing protein [Treponema sp.]
MKTVFGKSLLVLGLAALGISCFFVVSILVLMDSLYYETNMRNLHGTALVLRSVLPEETLRAYFPPGGEPGVVPPSAAYPDLSSFFGGEDGYRLTLINTEGVPLGDSRFDAGDLENHRERPEVAAALEGREGSSRRKSATAGIDLLYAALPVYRGNTLAGVFRLSRPVPNFWNRFAAAALPYLCLPILSILAAFGGVFIFSRSLSNSFRNLVGLTQTVSAETEHSGLSALPLISDTLEFTALEGALRSMAAELKGRIRTAREESRRLEAILNGMSEVVLAMDERLRLSLVNPQARDLFLIPPGTGISLLEATHSTELEEAARRVLTENRPLEFEISVHGPEKSRRFRVFAGPLSHIAGEGVIMVLGDITRLIKLEQIRRDFVANVSHELRTPIQLVKGFSETLLDTSLDDQEQIRRCIRIILKNAGAMENLTNDLLSLAALEDGNYRPEMELRNVGELMAEAALSAEFLARKKGSSIVIDCSPDLYVRFSGLLMVQALINLMDNAVKYAPPGSRVRAGAYMTEERELIFEVEDEGPGIPARHLERIFERFYRIDKARSREAGGTGLGLAIVRHIALLHGGTAEAESHAGEGSIFRIRIPVGG